MHDNTSNLQLNSNLLEDADTPHQPTEPLELVEISTLPITTPPAMAKLVGALIVENLSKNLSDIGLYYFVSRLGTQQLAASDIIANYSIFLSVFGYIGYPVITLLGAEIGKMMTESSSETTRRQYQLNQGSIIQNTWAIGGIVSLAPLGLALTGTPILRAIGTAEDLLPLVQQFLIPFAFALPPLIQTNLDNAILATFDHKRAIIILNTIRAGCEIGLGAILIPRLGLLGLGLTKLIGAWTVQSIFKTYFKCNAEFCSLSLFIPRLRTTIHYSKNIIKLGLPILVYSLALSGSGLATVIIMNRFGNDQLSLDQAVVQLINWFQVISVSISRASSMIVAKALGANQHTVLRRYGNISIFLSSVVFLPTLAIPLFPRTFLGIYLGQDVLDRLNSTTTVVSSLAVVEYIAGAIKDTSSENMRSLYDTVLPSIITSVGSLSIVPLSYLLGINRGYQMEGVYGAVVIVFVLIAIALFFRWLYRSTHSEQLFHHHLTNIPEVNRLTKENTPQLKLINDTQESTTAYQSRFFAHKLSNPSFINEATAEFKYA